MTNSSSSPIRIAVAEDSVLLREGLVRLFAEAGYETVAAVGDGESLLSAISEENLDLVVLDVRMPPTFHDEGIRTALQLRRDRPELAILLLSQYVELAYATELLAREAEGVGYLLKDRVTSLEEFTSAVERLLGGQTVLDPQIVKALMNRSLHPLEALTAREKEAMTLMAQGLSNLEISAVMVVGLGAVEKYISSIFHKLGLDETQGGHRRVLAVLAWLQK